jgi:cytochrome c oxidase subunit 3
MPEKPAHDPSLFDQAAKRHPLKLMVYFFLGGLSLLFLVLMYLFAQNDPGRLLGGQPFPYAFWISTPLIIAGSFTIEAAYRAFLRENSQMQLNFLLYTMVLAIGFAVAQGFGWTQLRESGITLYSVGLGDQQQGTPAGAYLFVISGLHLAHLAGGIVFLFMTMFRTVNVRGDEVRSMVYFTDRLEQTRLEMLARYWHFLGGLWLLLFLYFAWFFR